jgi:hypothetical protein
VVSCLGPAMSLLGPGGVMAGSRRCPNGFTMWGLDGVPTMSCRGPMGSNQVPAVVQRGIAEFWQWSNDLTIRISNSKNDLRF